MKKNIVFVSISVILLILLGIGLSYSMWNMSTSQETSNVIASSECFDISITSQENSISLQNAYPISNEKGKKLTPFTFSVTNVCETAAKYSINLESLKGSTLSSAFLDVMLNNGEIKRLNTYSSANKVNSSSIESRELETGILGNKESKDYSLRLWIDYDTTMEDLNNETKVLKSKVTVIGTPISYTGSTIFNFDYTGAEQTFTVPVTGTYKLETWGAEGGTFKEEYHGGYGGYSTGLIKLEKDQILNIVAGGKGKSGIAIISQNYGDAGYNGGGSRAGWTCENCDFGSSGGGGATHIATKSGLLSTLENDKSSILIVSGGGGGAGYVDTGWNYNPTGIPSGGGLKGNPGQSDSTRHGVPGTQTSGYSFGQAQNCADKGVCDGGGGGYYGGYFGNNGAGGGSGYIGNLLLTNKAMFCYNCEESNEESTKTISTTCNEETPTSYCAKKGNGYARITLVSIEE